MSKRLLNLYKMFLSPVFVHFFGHSCRFTPTCSEYAEEAIHKYGIFKGIFFSVKRVLKCNPFVKSGYDPLI